MAVYAATLHMSVPGGDSGIDSCSSDCRRVNYQQSKLYLVALNLHSVSLDLLSLSCSLFVYMTV